MARFADVFDDVTKLATKIPRERYLPSGRFQIIDQGQNKIAGYTNEPEGLYTDVPVIVFGDHTRAIKYVDRPLFLGADGVKLLKPKQRDANTKYLYYALSCANIPDTGYNRHFKWLKEIAIPEKPREEEERIVLTLDKIESLISLRKRQLAKLDELVKARFVEMFGDIICNNKKWNVAKLTDISSSRLGKMLDAKQQTGNNTYPYLANFNVQWFRFDLSNLNSMDFNDADQNEFSLMDGDLMVTEGGEVGRCAVWHNEIFPCFFQKAIHRIRCDNKKILPDYLSWWFKIHADYNAFEDVVGGVTSIAHLPGVKLKNLDVVVPPLDLQKQFALFVEQTNTTKHPVLRGQDELKTLKKALMQKYFG